MEIIERDLEVENYDSLLPLVGQVVKSTSKKYAYGRDCTFKIYLDEEEGYKGIVLENIENPDHLLYKGHVSMYTKEELSEDYWQI